MCGLCPTGNNVWSGVIENCYVNLSDAPTTTLSAAYAFAGAPHGLTIAHNTGIGANRGIHVDTPGGESPKAARNVMISNNNIYDCNIGIGIGDVDDDPLHTDHFEHFTIEANAIEMLSRSGIGIGLWGSTKGFQVKNNTILLHPGIPTSVYRTGIFISPGAINHVVTGNRFGPDVDAYVEIIRPVSYAEAAAQNNTIEDNTWIEDGVLPKVMTSLRLQSGGVPLPAGSSLWSFRLGADHSDSNPTTSLISSNLDGTDAYNFMWLSRAPGGDFTGYNTVLDPYGTSGVHIGDTDSGALAVGGWITAKTGIYLNSAAKLKISEGGNRMGVVTLVSGQATVSTSQVAANSRIFLTQQQDGGTPGAVRVSSRTVGTSFVIKSTSASDTSVVAWLIVDP